MEKLIEKVRKHIGWHKVLIDTCFKRSQVKQESKKCFEYSNSWRQNLKLFFPSALYLIEKHHLPRSSSKVASNVLYTP